MKTSFKNFALAGTILLVPMKSERAVISDFQPKKITKAESLLSTLKQSDEALAKWSNYTTDKIKEAEAKFALNFPRVPKPTRDLDVSKTRYFGSPEYLNFFLADGVMKGKGEHFCKAQKKHGINAAFLVSIANHESWYGKSDYARNRNNIAGMRNADGYIRFDSVDECIDKMAENLKTNYIDRGLKTISQINKKYAESTEWGDAIIKHMTPLYNNANCMIYNFK